MTRSRVTWIVRKIQIISLICADTTCDYLWPSAILKNLHEGKLLRSRINNAATRFTSYLSANQRFFRLAITKGYFALFEKKVLLTEAVSPREFLIFSIYVNAPVLETSSHLCCDRSCRDRGPRDSSMFKKSQSNFKSTEGAKYHFSLPLFIFLMSSTSRPLYM